jgi:hypothetical protein
MNGRELSTIHYPPHQQKFVDLGALSAYEPGVTDFVLKNSSDSF